MPMTAAGLSQMFIGYDDLTFVNLVDNLGQSARVASLQPG